jgi:high-affinity nickel-transport protein
LEDHAGSGTLVTGRWARVRRGLTLDEWLRVGGMALVVIALNVVGWGLLSAASGHHYHVSKTGLFGLGTGVLAYALGMRHAFDADHIAAIDNTTRALVRAGERPLSVGYYFSLGHSTVVFVLAFLLNIGIRALDAQVAIGSSGLHRATNLIGTSISGGFLYLIALLNLVVLIGIARVHREMKSGMFDNAELERQLSNRGLMNRFFGGFAARIDKPWKMYPVGVLFGLGFDTATEVALLVLAGDAVAGGLPVWAVLSLPFLFAAGMTLFDTIDGCFMNFAYDWAFSKPVRKVFYNLTMTGLSVFVAFFIGTIEVVGLVGSALHLNTPLVNFFVRFNINTAGFIIVGAFVVTWVVAFLYWRIAGLEAKWDATVIQPDPIEATAPG